MSFDKQCCHNFVGLYPGRMSSQSAMMHPLLQFRIVFLKDKEEMVRNWTTSAKRCFLALNLGQHCSNWCCLVDVAASCTMTSFRLNSDYCWQKFTSWHSGQNRYLNVLPFTDACSAYSILRFDRHLMVGLCSFQMQAASALDGHGGPSCWHSSRCLAARAVIWAADGGSCQMIYRACRPPTGSLNLLDLN